MVQPFSLKKRNSIHMCLYLLKLFQKAKKWRVTEVEHAVICYCLCKAAARGFNSLWVGQAWMEFHGNFRIQVPHNLIIFFL